MVWTEEDIEKVRKFIEIKRRGHYAESHELTSVYNRVLEKHVNNTTCGSCLRQRVEELERALRQYEADKAKKEAKKAEEETKVAEVDNMPQETKEAVAEQINYAQDEAELAQTIKEHEEAVDDLLLEAELESKGFLTEEEENNNGTEGKSPTTTKKRKASKPKTT